MDLFLNGQSLDLECRSKLGYLLLYFSKNYLLYSGLRPKMQKEIKMVLYHLRSIYFFFYVNTRPSNVNRT